MGESPKLYNHNVVYILGAGASVDAGMPVVANFLHRMRDSLEWLEGEQRAREVEAIRHVLQFRHEIASAAYRVQADPENIEDLFSLAAASAGESLTEHVNIAISATLDYSRVLAERRPRMGKVSFLRNAPGWTPPPLWQQQITNVTTSALVMPQGQRVSLPESPNVTLAQPVSELTYAHLTMRVWPRDERRHITIITFNYDLVAETMLDLLGLDWNYGTLDEGDDERPHGAHCITLLKLHGSINWGRPRNKPAGTPETHKTYEALLAADETPLIPPTWQKNRGDAMAFAWDDAVRALNSATRIGIFGFSLPWSDTHFKYLVAAGLRDNISLRRVAFATKQSDEPIARLWTILRPELNASLVWASESEIATFALGGGLSTFLGLSQPAVVALAN